jgi:hypothetical protein
MYKSAVYTPSNGDTLIKSGPQEIYYAHKDDSLHACVDIYLVNITWVPVMTWMNSTEVEQTYTCSHTTGLTVTNGTEVDDGISIERIFCGATVTTNHEKKVFTTIETSKSTTFTISVRVPPRCCLTFYQRKYRFKNRVSLIHSTSDKLYSIGDGCGKIAWKECEVEIMSSHYLTQEAPFAEEVKITLPPVKVYERPKDIKQGGYTQETRKVLDKLRLY